jgi:hypothetical protein
MVEAASTDFNCSGSYCFANSTCDNYYSSLKPLSFVTQNVTGVVYEFTIPPEGYTISGTGEQACVVAVYGNITDEPNIVVAGTTFFLNFQA